MRSVDTLCMGLAVFSGLILASIIGLTFTDVILRYIFSAPIFGARDLLEMGMVLVLSLAFPRLPGVPAATSSSIFFPTTVSPR